MSSDNVQEIKEVQHFSLRGWSERGAEQLSRPDLTGDGGVGEAAGDKGVTRVAVVGAGNLGQAMAAHIALHEGYECTLGNRTASRLDPITEQGNVIKVSLPGEEEPRDAQLQVVSGDMAEVLDGAHLVMMCVPACGQSTLMEMLLPHITEGMHLLLHPGNLHGALNAYEMIRRHRPNLCGSVTVSELESSILTCRAPTMGNVEVFAVKNKLGISTIPSTETDAVLSLLKPIYEEHVVPRANVLFTSLHDLNFVVHPIVTMMNAGPIDRGSPFLYYAEGVTPHVAKLLEAADEERCAIIVALGMRPISLRDWIIDEYRACGAQGDTVHSLITTNPAFATLLAPKKLYTRYIFEDVPCALLPAIELGERLNVPTPLLRAMYEICKCAFGEDWVEDARTLKNMSLGHLSMPQLLNYVTTGEFLHS